MKVISSYYNYRSDSNIVQYCFCFIDLIHAYYIIIFQKIKNG